MGKNIRKVIVNQFRLLVFRPIRPDLDGHGGCYVSWCLLVAWLAGIGRYWDNPRAALWQHLGLGSVVYIFVLALLLWLLIRPLQPRHWRYRNVLVFVGLTALPGILYGIPVERFFPIGTAQAINVWFLALVAAWRVALLFNFLARTAGLSTARVIVAALLPLTIIVAALTALNLEHVVFNVMAGIDPGDISPHDEAYGVLFLLTFFSLYAFPVLLLAYIVMIVADRKANKQRAGH